jgi:hypothetical protein
VTKPMPPNARLAAIAPNAARTARAPLEVHTAAFLLTGTGAITNGH